MKQWDLQCPREAMCPHRIRRSWHGVDWQGGRLGVAGLSPCEPVLLGARSWVGRRVRSGEGGAKGTC